MSDWSPFLGLPLWVWLFVIPTALAAIARLQRARLMPLLRRIWRVLDAIYLASGVLAAVFMVMILLRIVLASLLIKLKALRKRCASTLQENYFITLCPIDTGFGRTGSGTLTTTLVLCH